MDATFISKASHNVDQLAELIGKNHFLVRQMKAAIKRREQQAFFRAMVQADRYDDEVKQAFMNSFG